MWLCILRICPLVVMVYFFSPNEDQSCFAWPWHHPLCHPGLFMIQPRQGANSVDGFATNCDWFLWRGIDLRFFFFFMSWFFNCSQSTGGMGCCNPGDPKCVRCCNKKKGCWDRWFTCQLGYFVLQLVVALWQDGRGQPADIAAFDPRPHLFSPVTIGWKLCLERYTELIPLWLLSFVKFPFSLNQASIAFSAISSSPAGFALLRWPEDFLLWVMLCWVCDSFFLSFFLVIAGLKQVVKNTHMYIWLVGHNGWDVLLTHLKGWKKKYHRMNELKINKSNTTKSVSFKPHCIKLFIETTLWLTEKIIKYGYFIFILINTVSSGPV